jgi:hypothetical protein
MKATFLLTAVAALAVAPTPCFALWEIAPVTKERAKELGLEVRSQAAGPDAVRVEVEFKTDGALKDFDRVDLRVGRGTPSVVTAALKEDRSKPGRVVVSFSADRSRLDQIFLWVMVPAPLGGTAHEIRVTDFVEADKGR